MSLPAARDSTVVTMEPAASNLVEIKLVPPKPTTCCEACNCVDWSEDAVRIGYTDVFTSDTVLKKVCVYTWQCKGTGCKDPLRDRLSGIDYAIHRHTPTVAVTHHVC